MIESRERAIAHVVVETDRAGADIVAFDGGTVLTSDTVSGSTEHIHRGHPGGWSQRRFQQRAESTWENNAREVAEAVAEISRRVDAQLVAIAGDVRAQAFVLQHLPADIAEIAVKVDAGSSAGITEEVGRRLSTLVAERITARANRVRAGVDADLAATDVRTVVETLREGRVETLLVHDDDSNCDDIDVEWLDGARLVDRGDRRRPRHRRRGDRRAQAGDDALASGGNDAMVIASAEPTEEITSSARSLWGSLLDALPRNSLRRCLPAPDRRADAVA